MANFENLSEEATNKAKAEDNQQTEKTDKSSASTDKQDEKEKENKLSPLEQLQQENEKLKDQLLRTIAEFDNFRKRTTKEKSDLILNGGKKTVTAILPVLDDFERALEDGSTDVEAVKAGMQMIFNKFIKTLESMGVKKIDTQKADFNTDYHEAVAMVPGMGDENKGKVIDCVQTGYTMNDEVIRHAKVAVGQ
ncbi:MAG: nucleotide exchange factor GrpE [Prevotella sp.]|jgi:grpE|nr:nucleotide exchange factor GrpE [Prevotella sp.]MBF1585744.1 nucleotide exchange factor GrpE [Prevotella sp.]MBF1587465.1 nucleotide exchange factor GrpE [Prevotella sp.]